MTDAHTINMIIKEGEGLTVEFKEHFTPRMAEDIVAFANTKGGLILLGVRDNKTVVGEKLTNDLKSRINSVARNCSPPLPIKIMQVRDIVAVEVPQSEEKPCSCSAGYFRRLDGTTQKMTNHELRVMFRENETTPFEEKTVEGFSFDDISKGKIRAFVKEAGIHIDKIATPDFLRSLNVAGKSAVKNAGILFFARDVHKHLHQAQMTLLAFKGTKKLLILDRHDVQDDLLTQFNEAILFLKRHLNVRSEIRDVNRVDIYEIPFDAIREALVNALMHRDYSITGTQISIEVYDDRIEITNPGGLPPGLPRKSFGGMSVRRNELIADLFFRLHKVERVGMGIQKMRETMKTAGLKEPEFETDGYFRTTFRRPERLYPVASPDSRSAAQAPAQLQPELQPKLQPELQPESLEIRLLRLLHANIHSKTELSERLGQKAVSGPLNNTVRSLLAAGLIRYTIPEKPNSRLQRYQITTKGKTKFKTSGKAPQGRS